MHPLATEVRSLSSGTMTVLMRQSSQCPIDPSRYENIDRMQNAFISFTDSIIKTASEMNMPVPYERWQDLWQAFETSPFFNDGLGISHSETSRSI